MPPEDFQSLLQFFKVLANENRLKLVGILAQKECNVEELAALLGLKEPTVSHHLNKLKALKLVQMRSEGNTHWYCLNGEALQELNKRLLTPDRAAAMVPVIDSQAWEDKVKRSFLSGDRIVEIPASRKKRLVILHWLVEKFEPEQTYPERILNDIIKQHHPDCATLRRELIGYCMMQRENGRYWRLPKTEWKIE